MAEAAVWAKAGGPEPTKCCGKGKYYSVVGVGGKELGPRTVRLLCVLIFAKSKQLLFTFSEFHSSFKAINQVVLG